MQSIVNSQPTKTVLEHSVPASTEGIILPNFDIANEEEKTSMQQKLNEDKIEAKITSSPVPNANKIMETTRQQRLHS